MLYLLIGVILIAADQAAKFWARGALAHGGNLGFIPHIMDFAYVENRGAAFGILQDTRWLLIGMTVAVLGIILAYAIKSRKRHPLFLLSVSLIFGYVTDFLRFLFIEFPCFNIADVCVCVGGALFVIYLLFLDKSEKSDADV